MCACVFCGGGEVCDSNGVIQKGCIFDQFSRACKAERVQSFSLPHKSSRPFARAHLRELRCMSASARKTHKGALEHTKKKMSPPSPPPNKIRNGTHPTKTKDLPFCLFVLCFCCLGGMGAHAFFFSYVCAPTPPQHTNKNVAAFPHLKNSESTSWTPSHRLRKPTALQPAAHLHIPKDKTHIQWDAFGAPFAGR